MAIDDNTSYELTGAQVKDLANKIKGKAADNNFVGATSAAPGSKGLVPQPQAGDDTKFLSGDGSWKTVGNYSTTEQAIGIWIDGRTIYRKVIAGTTDSSNYESVQHGITNFGAVINIYGYIHAANNESQPIQRVAPDAISSFGIGVGDIDATRIAFQHPASNYKSRPYAIVMEYIKTS